MQTNTDTLFIVIRRLLKIVVIFFRIPGYLSTSSVLVSGHYIDSTLLHEYDAAAAARYRSHLTTASIINSLQYCISTATAAAAAAG